MVFYSDAPCIFLYSIDLCIFIHFFLSCSKNYWVCIPERFGVVAVVEVHAQISKKESFVADDDVRVQWQECVVSIIIFVEKIIYINFAYREMLE